MLVLLTLNEFNDDYGTLAYDVIDLLMDISITQVHYLLYDVDLGFDNGSTACIFITRLETQK